MTQTLNTTERLGVVDALRGFALLAIVLLHNLEHYNLFLPLECTLPARQIRAEHLQLRAVQSF